MFFDLRGKMKKHKYPNFSQFIGIFLFNFIFVVGGTFLLEKIFDAPIKWTLVVLYCIGFLITRIYLRRL